VTVKDTEPPMISCPVDIGVSTDPGVCGAKVTYLDPTVSDNCPGATVACNPPSGSFFAKGVTPVICTATDAAGNASTCTFNVTVKDTEPPAITCPVDVVVSNDAGQCGAVVNYPAPVASDNCPGVSVVCNPLSGSFFPIGTTTVTCKASDASGNVSSCAFDVTVENQITEVALRIRRQGGNVVISWPGPCTGNYVPEQTFDLTPPIHWAPVLEPVVPVGGRLQVTTPASGGMRYFRLRKL